MNTDPNSNIIDTDTEKELEAELETKVESETSIEIDPTTGLQSENPETELFPKLLRMVRWAGISGMALAGYLFVMRDGIGENMVASYYTFLAFTVLLTVFGWFCAKRWQDSAGARTLFGLSAALLPVHMAQHSAFILTNINGWDHNQWHLGGATLLTLLLTSLPVLIFTTWLGYAGWLRKHAKVFAPLYILTNLALLLPFRSGESVFLTGLAMGIPCLAIAQSLRKNNNLLGTKEGITARLTLGMPFLLLIGRSIYSGNGDAFLYSFALGFVSIILSFSVVPELKSKAWRNFVRFFSLTFLLGSWSLIWLEGISLLNGSSLWIPASFYFPPFIIAMFQFYNNGSSDTRETKPLRIFVGVLFAIAFFYHLFFADAVQVSLLGMVSGALLLLGSLKVQEKWMLILSGWLIIVSNIVLIYNGLKVVDSVNWITVGVIGLLLFVSVSVVEKKRVEIHKLLKSRKSLFQEWDS